MYTQQCESGVRCQPAEAASHVAMRSCGCAGAWEGDVKQGFGVMHYEDGSTYEGEWAGDVKQGLGLMRWGKQQEQYRGQWAGDAQNGVGEHVWLGLLPQAQAPGSGTTFFLMQNRSAWPGVRQRLLGRRLLLWPLAL